MLLNVSEIPRKIELHYNFFDDSHTMDAVVRNNCERELLAIANEIATILDIEINIETEAYLEGGLKKLWSVVSKNKVLIVVITSILINVLSTYLTQYRELTKLQKQELQLKIEKLKREPEEGNEGNVRFSFIITLLTIIPALLPEVTLMPKISFKLLFCLVYIILSRFVFIVFRNMRDELEDNQYLINCSECEKQE